MDNQLVVGEAGEEVSDFLDVYEGEEEVGGDEEEEGEGDVEGDEEETGEAVAVAPEVVLIESDDEEEDIEEYDEDEGKEYFSFT